MDDFTPEQKQQIEKMMDERIKQRERQLRKKTMGVKGWLGVGAIVLSILLRMLGAPAILVVPPLFILAFYLIYSEGKDKLEKKVQISDFYQHE